MTRTLRVAMIGHGFMGAAHSQAWRTAPRVFALPSAVELSVIVGRDATAVAEAARTWGWREAASDWREVIARDDIDVVDIVTPGHSHAEIAIAALEAGKHVLCEKPLANTVAEAERMTEAARSAAERGIVAMLGFTYRRVPALSLARDLVADGRIGRVQQVRSAYRQDWLVDPRAPLSWRLEKEKAGAGALGDIGGHAVDLVQFLTGQRIERVTGVLDTIVTERPVETERIGIAGVGGEEMGPVTVDDVAMFTARLECGALAGFEATRFATGRKNALSVELSGDRGAIAFDLEDLNVLWVYDRDAPVTEQGFTRIVVTEPGHPYLEGWWPAGHMLGYEHAFSHQVKDLIEGIASGTTPAPSFEEGLHVQRVLAAVEESASAEARWMEVPMSTGGERDSR
ncbi:Gfo/Idh/MocA family oxidoreductase [Microbacterium oryzae]|uniref:Gfo/Idh/MocA family protein n=1 Tax=Microbacterium oryzae TaxID=743009 RepID=UPI0025AF249B|nr:Gfo/Idh/MocA family oxidoreductase [Microbacterium oryzae]MDN3310918.1 Gfo/Idh/MocA family oxidoreductase [Microbacterium oryzae]